MIRFMIHCEENVSGAGPMLVTWKQAVNDKETFAELLDAFLSGPIPSKVGAPDVVMGGAATVGTENRV